MVGHRSPRVWVMLVVMGLAGVACTLSSAADNTPVDVQTRPLVLLLAPANGSTYAEGVEVFFHAIAQESQTGVVRLEFRVNDTPVGEVAASDPNGQPSLDGMIIWTASGKTGHLVTVEAFRPDGSSMGLSDVTIKVADKPVARLPGGGGETPGQDQPTPVPTPTAGDAAAVPPTNAVPLTGTIAQANVDDLNLRQGPGTDYPSVGTLALGERVQIVGRSADDSWWAVAYGGGTAWVFAALTTTEGDVSQVPLLAAPPAP